MHDRRYEKAPAIGGGSYFSLLVYSTKAGIDYGTINMHFYLPQRFPARMMK